MRKTRVLCTPTAVDKISCAEGHGVLKIDFSKISFSVNTYIQGLQSRTLTRTLGKPGRRYKVSCAEGHGVLKIDFMCQAQGQSASMTCLLAALRRSGHALLSPNIFGAVTETHRVRGGRPMHVRLRALTPYGFTLLLPGLLTLLRALVLHLAYAGLWRGAVR